MRNRITILVLALVIIAAVAFGATKTYQVTGPVLAFDANSITVEKGKDKWELARDANTKITGDLKVGSKVTIEYRMTATTVDVKAATPAKPAKKK